MNWVLLSIFLVFFLLALLAVVLVLRARERQRRQRLMRALEAAGGEQPLPERAELLALPEQERRPWAYRLLEWINLRQLVEDRLQQAGLDWTLDKLVGLSVASGVLAGLLALKFEILLSPGLSFLAGGGFGVVLPWMLVERKRAKRLSEIEEQLPEALDFIARALRAGHAFSVSLEMLAEESAEPLRTEFRKVYQEQSLGAPLETALRNLARRVPLVDVQFFVSAVLLQRETGGNLSEVLLNLSKVIRERFRLKGHVKALSASARLTGTILIIMPFVLGFLLNIINPGYLRGMIEDPLGKNLLVGAAISQALGIIVIRKIIDIRV